MGVTGRDQSKGGGKLSGRGLVYVYRMPQENQQSSEYKKNQIGSYAARDLVTDE